MIKYGLFQNPSDETYDLTLIKKDEGNVPFTYGEREISDGTSIVKETHNVGISFKGKPANQYEKKSYRVTKGVESTNASILIISSNLPNVAEVGDYVVYLGKPMTIQSVGLIVDNKEIMNAGIFSPDYIEDRARKGIQLG